MIKKNTKRKRKKNLIINLDLGTKLKRNRTNRMMRVKTKEKILELNYQKKI
jgi:hypothetical protein